MHAAVDEAEQIVAEAVGGAYSEYARLSSASGVPTYLGWANHEGVWRGGEIYAETGRREAIYKIPEKEFPVDPAKPNVKLFGTGGTIASRLDYRTGAVIPAFTPGELYGAVPELADICNLKTEKLFGVFSENMGPEQWIRLAEAIGKEIEKGI